MAQNLFTVTATKKNGRTRTAQTILLGSARVVDILTKASGAATLIKYAEKNRTALWYVTTAYATVAAYLGNNDVGKHISVNILKKGNATYAVTKYLKVDNIILGWADPDDATQCYVIYDDKPGIKSMPVKYLLDHPLTYLYYLSDAVTTTTTTAAVTTTTTTAAVTTTTTTGG